VPPIPNHNNLDIPPAAADGASGIATAHGLATVVASVKSSNVGTGGPPISIEPPPIVLGGGAPFAGGRISTMLPHFGHAWISPITLGLLIFSRA